MHPPFYIPDPRVSVDVTPHLGSKRIVRRGEQSQRLRLLPFGTWPPVYPVLHDRIDDPVPALPTGRPAPGRPSLSVVPAPRSVLRDQIGRFLIRVGQRMILENRPG